MLDIVICEDNHFLLDQMARLIEKITKKYNLDAKIAYKANNPEMVEAYMKSNRGSVFFLDIDLKSSETGYSLAKKIRELYFDAYIIFVSAHLEYLMQAFKVQAFDFLPKPVHPDTLEQTLLNICKNHQQQQEKYMLPERYIDVKNGTSIVRVHLKDIVYIEKELSKTVLHLADGDISCKLSLEYMESDLLDENFIRCHRAFIVNKTFLSQIHSKENEITLSTGQKCLIGRKYRQNLLQHVI